MRSGIDSQRFPTLTSKQSLPQKKLKSKTSKKGTTPSKKKNSASRGLLESKNVDNTEPNAPNTIGSRITSKQNFENQSTEADIDKRFRINQSKRSVNKLAKINQFFDGSLNQIDS